MVAELQRKVVVNDNYERLALAILALAVKDAIQPAGVPYSSVEVIRYQARAWLAGPDAAFYAESLGYDSERLTLWVSNGCRQPVQTVSKNGKQ